MIVAASSILWSLITCMATLAPMEGCQNICEQILGTIPKSSMLKRRLELLTNGKADYFRFLRTCPMLDAGVTISRH